MSATTYSPRLNGDRPSPRRRAVSLALALAIEVLLLLAFFTLNFREKRKPEFEGGRLTTFDLSAESEADRSAAPQKQPEVTPAPVRPPRPVPPIPKPAIEIPERPLDMIIVSKEVFEASDIARLGNPAPAGEAAGQLAQGRSPGDSAIVGTAPNGEPLYAAEWYREPTNTELAAYMPRSMVQGGGTAWGLIACKTAPRYRVTDCVELGSSTGSRLAGAARQAAWQFLVRPPRIGGKPMVGEWVRIRITIGDGGEKESD